MEKSGERITRKFQGARMPSLAIGSTFDRAAVVERVARDHDAVEGR